MDQVVERLAKRFPRADHTHIVETVRDEFNSLADSTIRIYVANLIEHDVRGQLSAEARAKNLAAKAPASRPAAAIATVA
jgi:hypothetical protein